MKTKNLLLAGLVAVAMSACSNSEDILDNKIQAPTGEEAGMRVSFTVPATGARAVIDGGVEAGDLNESKITTATIVLDYGGSKRIVKNNLTLNETPDAGKNYIATTEAFIVTKGTGVNIYAFINPSDALNNQIATVTDLSTLATGEQALPESGLNYLTGTVAKNENFLMSGLSKNITIEAKDEANTATIEVNRVSAKLDEQTDPADGFLLTKPTVDFNENNQKQDLSVRFLQHSYTNLANNSSVMSNEVNYAGGFLQAFEAAPYRWIDKGITYCLENRTDGTWTKTTTTNVHYKAQVYANGNPIGTFFVKKFINSANEEKSIIYKTWAEMKAKYGNLPEAEPTTAEELKKYDITKFVDGICYYVAPIEHVAKGMTIIRNNWYQLNVNTVKDLGWPTETTPEVDKDAKLIVKATIKPWTIHKNNIDL